MNPPIVHSLRAVLLVGGGVLSKNVLQQDLAGADCVVAADSGASVLLDMGRLPDAVIGDMDSLDQANRAAIPPERVHHIAEQDSTDFDKCLRHIAAPLVIGHGFLGGRLDHQLAALTVLARYPDRRCILVGEEDVVMLAPPELSLDLPLGSRLSLYPLAPVTGQSTGLRWPIDGLVFAPNAVVGTSNEVSGPVTLAFDGPAMALILPLAGFRALLDGLEAAPLTWPARA